MLPAREESRDNNKYENLKIEHESKWQYFKLSDLIELQMEVCDPEGVEDAGQEDHDDPGVEDEPGYQEAALLPVQGAHAERVTERGEDREQKQHAPVEEVIKVLSESFLRVCD